MGYVTMRHTDGRVQRVPDRAVAWKQDRGWSLDDDTLPAPTTPPVTGDTITVADTAGDDEPE